MEIELLKEKIQEIKNTIENTVTSANFVNSKGETKQKDDGLQAKVSLITSGQLIQNIHEVVKISLKESLEKEGFKNFSIHPPIGKSSPEKDVWGFLKKKKQDVVVLFEKEKEDEIEEGPLKGTKDLLGKNATKYSIVIGIRSQLSSVGKNTDTLMERAFAETFNLRLRHPYLVMGEVYMLVVKEYDEQAMKENRIEFKDNYSKVENYISIFNAMSGRDNYNNILDSYKYEKSALVLVDFSQEPAKVYKSLEELKDDGVVSQAFNEDYSLLAPQNFVKNLIKAYKERHNISD